MKIEFDCIPCICRQILEASRMVTKDKEVIRKIINEFAQTIPEIQPEESAPIVITRIQNFLKEITGENDPYIALKAKNIQLAQDHYPIAEDFIKKAKKPLLAALLMSAMGNSIDAGVSLEVDIKGNVELALKDGFSASDFSLFQEKLDKAKSILIIADNAGETVFDKLLIKELDRYNVDITYAVRDKAILNDVTMKEAKDIGIDNCCTLISSGCDTPGTILGQASQEFLNLYHSTDIIISKGQGNLEGLLGDSKPIFFLLKIKCQLIANRLGGGLKTGSLIFKLLYSK